LLTVRGSGGERGSKKNWGESDNTILGGGVYREPLYGRKRRNLFLATKSLKARLNNMGGGGKDRRETAGKWDGESTQKLKFLKGLGQHGGGFTPGTLKRRGGREQGGGLYEVEV